MSNKNPIADIGFPELFWNAAFFAFKYAVEIGDIVETAFVGNISDSISSIYEHPRSVP